LHHEILKNRLQACFDALRMSVLHGRLLACMQLLTGDMNP